MYVYDQVLEQERHQEYWDHPLQQASHPEGYAVRHHNLSVGATLVDRALKCTCWRRFYRQLLVTKTVLSDCTRCLGDLADKLIYLPCAAALELIDNIWRVDIGAHRGWTDLSILDRAPEGWGKDVLDVLKWEGRKEDLPEVLQVVALGGCCNLGGVCLLTFVGVTSWQKNLHCGGDGKETEWLKTSG